MILHEDHSVPRVHMSIRYRTGSSRETPGKTGFAHLFEHLMFEGSAHVPEGKFDEWLEAAGGENNAWTSEDFTYYFEEAPSNSLELMLFVESDRLAYFLDKLDKELVDGQREVVKNERRQSYENRPYGKADLLMPSLLWPKGHPYSWPVIGSMEDLGRASIDDVRAFFSTWYAPENAILVLVGDFKTKEARALVDKWFSEVPSRGGKPAPTPQTWTLPGERRAVVEDDVELARLSIAWPSVHLYHEDDAALDVLAAVLGDGESSRLSRRLVHELRVAQSVNVSHQSQDRAGQFQVDVLALPGKKLSDIARIVDEEVARLVREGPSVAELARVQAVIESHQIESLDSLSAKAAQLSQYAMLVGDADWFEEDLARWRAVTPADVQRVGKKTLGRGRVVLSVVPNGQLDKAVLNPVLPALGGAR